MGHGIKGAESVSGYWTAEPVVSSVLGNSLAYQMDLPTHVFQNKNSLSRISTQEAVGQCFGAIANGGDGRIRTAVEGFADLCLAPRPRHQYVAFKTSLRNNLEHAR